MYASHSAQTKGNFVLLLFAKEKPKIYDNTWHCIQN